MKKKLLILLSVVFLSVFGYSTINSDLYKSISQMHQHTSAEDRIAAEECVQQSDGSDRANFSTGDKAAITHQINNIHTISKETLNSGLQNEIVFSCKEDALKFLLSKFSQKELEGFAQKTQDGISSEEFQEIMSCVFSRLSPGEYKALEALVLSELGKKQISISELRSIAGLAQNGATPDNMDGIIAALNISPEEYNKLEIVVLDQLNKNNN